VAASARGIADRVTASFTGLTKPKPRLRARPSAGTRPAAAAPAGADPAGASLAGPGNQAGPHLGGPAPVRSQAGSRPQATRPQSRQAQLTVERVEPWSVMKFSFLISLVAFVVLFVAVAILYFTLSKIGVFTQIEKTWGAVTYHDHQSSNLSAWFSASRILGYTMLIGAVNVVIITALSTVGAVVYNLVTALTGGIEVTLKESD
jgi:cell division protein FtsL